jgi:hypothetical protein
MTIATTLLAVALSGVLILWLAIGDPKRRRAQRVAGAGQGTTTRRLIAVAAMLPGIWLAGNGNVAAFLVWLGGCCAAGWFIALGFGGPRGDRA